MFLPPRIHFVKKCDRCGLSYPRKKMLCTHCNDLTDGEVEQLKQKYVNERGGNANIGKFFIFIAILLVIGIVVFK